MATRTTPGVVYRHSRDCIEQKRQAICGNRCNPSDAPWDAWVYSKRDGKKIRASALGQRFATQAAAKSWRIDALKAVQDKRLRAPSAKTLREEWAEWLEGAREGRILNKRKERYKPAVLRNYAIALERRVLPVLGDRKLANIDTRDLLELKEQLLGEGHSGSTIRNSFVPLQALYRRARRNNSVPVNPTLDLELPTSGTRDRAATPAAAAELLGALGEREAALWATAFYAGLRRGELQALRVRDVDFDAGTIRVEQSWDAGGGPEGRKDVAGPVPPKSKAGTRTVFMLDVLRPHLRVVAEDDREPDALFFGRTPAAAFDPRTVEREARKAWTTENERRQKEAEENGTKAALVEWFTPHDARHSFSTFMDHAGVSETRADRYMGHSAPGVAGRYRHLLPGQIAEDARRVDEYLAGTSAGKVMTLPAASGAA